MNLKGVYVPLTSFIQHPTIEFILNLASEDLKNDCLENPTAEDFDIDDILSILNDWNTFNKQLNSLKLNQEIYRVEITFVTLMIDDLFYWIINCSN